MSLDHAMNVGGFGRRVHFPLFSLLGKSVIAVSWDGCMATERTEVGRGKIIRLHSRELYGGGGRSTPGVDIAWSWRAHGEPTTGNDGWPSWAPLDSIRIVRTTALSWLCSRFGRVEVWS